MALDSQSKRMSAAGAGRPYMRATFPVATPSASWRSSVGLTYNGNAFAAPPVGGRSTMPMRQMGYLQQQIRGFRSIILFLFGAV